MFQLVEVRELKVNQKYKIKDNFLEYMGRFKGMARFYRDEKLCVCFDKLYNITICKSSARTLFDDTAKFYSFVSEQPRWKMERRAVIMIVRRLIGDPCFEW